MGFINRGLLGAKLVYNFNLCQKPAKSIVFYHISLIYDRKRDGSMQQIAAIFHAYLFTKRLFFFSWTIMTHYFVQSMPIAGKI
jgi:hypothetical protein